MMSCGRLASVEACRDAKPRVFVFELGKLIAKL
jgi:hypothetical protein